MRHKKLNNEQVNRIRNNPEKSIRDFATELGVSHITVRAARQGLGAYNNIRRVSNVQDTVQQDLPWDTEFTITASKENL